MRGIVYNYLFLINVLGFLTMYIDKRRAIKKKWRISEKTLLLIALIGGSLGSFLGMRLYRHKVNDLKFSIGLPVMMFIQLCIAATIIGK
ncbi:MAG: DUF1294 domain-containing protein [Clostridium sp.]|uniref:DUF1294 domain-containing protein n=1 Tax=Clostridium sp. TaxID=1506 RepID=UPI002FCA263F